MWATSIHAYVMVQYYDLILGLVPLTLGGITAALVAVGVAFTVAVPLAALVAVALIGHGMFVRAPKPPSAPHAATEGVPTNSAD